MTGFPIFTEYDDQGNHTIFDQFVGWGPQALSSIGLSPQDYTTMIIAIPHATLDSYKNLKKNNNSQGGNRDVSASSIIKQDKNKFQVNVDVRHFAADEISVKTYDGYLVVEGKHDERQDEHGLISRGFSRRYVLPEDVDANALISRLSSDGVLSIKAPYIISPPQSENERIVPIVQTGPVKKQPEIGKTEPAQG